MALDTAIRAESRYKMIVGVDYGTTYSGISYVASNKSSVDDIVVMSKWPNHRDTTWKTPTTIAYAHENDKLTKNKWGFEVTPGLKQYTWTKLLLDKKVELTEFDDPLLEELYGEGFLKLPDGKSAQTVAEDYLRELYNFTIKTLEKELSAEVFRTMPMECWITMPAIWSDQAQAATRDAARKAGFGSRSFDTVNMITEPEAAALVAMKPHLGVDALDPVLPGECILVCDCGGGTVDITTYEIVQIKPILNYKEICHGMGGKCGSTSIDRYFIKWMTLKFGDAYTSLPMKKRGPGSRFMDSFESAKRNFDSVGDDRPFEIGPIDMDVPWSPSYDDDEQVVKLSRVEMAGLFDPTIRDLVRLVETQAKLVRAKGGKTVDRFILVGGFGDSEYLNRKLKEWCNRNKVKRFTCPANCQAAIVKGAALRGLEGLKPSVTVARRHYGWSWNEYFREGIDDEKDALFLEWDNVKVCKGRMHWPIKKGQELDESTVAAVEAWFVRSATGTDRKVSTLKLYSCNLDDPPEREEHYGVTYVGTIESDFTSVSDKKIKSQWNAKLQKTVFQYNFTLEIKFRSQEGVLSFNSTAYGKERGMTKVSFDK